MTLATITAEHMAQQTSIRAMLYKSLPRKGEHEEEGGGVKSRYGNPESQDYRQPEASKSSSYGKQILSADQATTRAQSFSSALTLQGRRFP
ncbi:hypothetical protein CDAR_600861 [Caerostris darwini]|uniref:Uncharacterized protein n=1 Tax=Caerostris darwini TaxID=1538125 RepID=A0AAV4TX11_9ARAC|nr:hypothetical protein CDAR_600861 [Caerostris darwini]